MTTLIKRDGRVIASVSSPDAAFKWLLDAQPQSVDWACKYEGYSIAASDGTTRSFKVMCHGAGDPTFHFVSNAQRFASRDEAQRAGSELWSRWFGMDDFFVLSSEGVVNCTADAYGRCTFLPGALR